METIFKKHWKTALFMLGGSLIVFAYWRFIGCTRWTISLTSNWHITTLFGGVVGMMVSHANRKSTSGDNTNQS